MKSFMMFSLFLCAMAAGCAFADNHNNDNNEIQIRLPRRVERNRRFTIDMAGIPAGIENPFDPDVIEITGLFTAPSGRRLEMPAYFMEGFDPIFRVPTRRGGWRLGFMPAEVGEYSLRVYMRLNGGDRLEIGSGLFESTASANPGLPVVAFPPTGHFRLPDGGEFFPVGINYGWGDSENPRLYLEQLDRLAGEGVNLIRLWLAPWWIQLERTADRYDQRAAGLLDAIIEHCEANGIYVIICVEQHSAFWDRENHRNFWSVHPYNAAQGGPLRTRSEFFSSPAAMEMTEKKLRYIVARWGASPNVFAWELFNEVEYFPFDNGNLTRNMPAVLDWHRRMARSLRDLDPYGRIISTSSDVDLQRMLLLEGLIDIVQLHIYEDGDPLEKVVERLTEAASNFGAPVIAGEFGEREPVEAVSALARGTWASLFTGAGAAGLYWWDWGNVLEQERLPFDDIRRFIDGVKWNEERFRAVEIDLIRPVEDGALLEDLVILPGLPFGGAGGVCVARRDGNVRGADATPAFLLAPDQEERRSPLIIDVDFAAPGRIKIHIDTVSDEGLLIYSVDGQIADRLPLPTGVNNPAAVESIWIDDWGVFQDVYDREYSLEVPAGRRRLRIENRGSGWVKIDRIILENYSEVQPRELRGWALAGRESVLLYIAAVSDGIEGVIPAMKAQIQGIAPSDYRVEWHDCRTDEILGVHTARAEDGVLVLDVPEFEKHVAARITRMERPAN